MFNLRLRSLLPVIGVALALAAAATPLTASSRSVDDLLALVPADAASVAVVHLSDLRSSPVSAKLFSGADHMTADGDAARFLEEAQLDPKRDVDTVVVAGRPSAGSGGAPVLALVEGHFDPDRLTAAVVSRGAVRRSTPAGDYYLLPDKHEHDRPAAAAFVTPSLVIVGTESAVAQALADRRAGGTGFASGSGLGRELKRVDRGSSVWVLVDVTRYPSVAHRSARVHVEADADADHEPALAIMGAMKSVSLVAVQAKANGDSLELSATGLASDADTRQLLEDSLRGVLAMWRLAVQDKSPELVTVLRKFTVSSDSEAVSIHGTLPGSFLRSVAAHAKHRGSQSD